MLAFDLHNMIAGEPFAPLSSMRAVALLIMGALNAYIAYGIFQRKPRTVFICRIFSAIYGAVFIYNGLIMREVFTGILGVVFIALGFYFAGPQVQAHFQTPKQ